MAATYTRTQLAELDERGFPCEFAPCDHRAPNVNGFLAHAWLAHNGRMPIGCALCSWRFPNESLRNDHMSASHLSQLYTMVRADEPAGQEPSPPPAGPDRDDDEPAGLLADIGSSSSSPPPHPQPAGDAPAVKRVRPDNEPALKWRWMTTIDGKATPLGAHDTQPSARFLAIGTDFEDDEPARKTHAAQPAGHSSHARLPHARRQRAPISSTIKDPKRSPQMPRRRLPQDTREVHRGAAV